MIKCIDFVWKILYKVIVVCFSVIRPWKLAEGQQLTNKKCDPVALYHKYQQEWNKFTFPGEDNRTKLRWEIREKMLGTDPNPKVRQKHIQNFILYIFQLSSFSLDFKLMLNRF